MANNLRKFNTSADYSAATLVYPAVSYVAQSDNVMFDKTAPTPPPTPHDYSQDYFTIRVIEDIDIVWAGAPLSYSIDGGTTWSEPSSDITLSAVTSGSTVMFKGGIASGPIGKFDTGGAGKFEVEGNIMSLLYGDNFVGQTVLPIGDAFANMFTLGKTIKTYNLISAENLVLPATTLNGDCYRAMFQGCAALVTPPKILPATTLTKSNYGCYNSMFANCTSLTTAPELPATTLADSCYSMMFKGCTSLSAITCLATDISASNCTTNWVNGVAASGTFTKAASMTDWTTGNNGIPSGWTVADYAE